MFFVLTAKRREFSCIEFSYLGSSHVFPFWRLSCRAPHLHTRLNSFKLCLRMVSLTATKTKRMFSVSVAQVKWGYRVLSLSGFCSWYIFRMNSWAAVGSCWGPVIQGWTFCQWIGREKWKKSNMMRDQIWVVFVFFCLLIHIFSSLGIPMLSFQPDSTLLRNWDAVKCHPGYIFRVFYPTFYTFPANF